MQASRHSPHNISADSCLFCNDWGQTLRENNPTVPGQTLVVTPEQFMKHVGGHMVQLALFSLPRVCDDNKDAGSNAAAADTDTEKSSNLDGVAKTSEMVGEEQHNFLDISLVSDESFRNHHGFDLTSFLLTPNDPAAPKTYSVPRVTRVCDFIRQIAEEKGLEPEQIRFWTMVNRQNRTIRPDQTLVGSETPVEEAWKKQCGWGRPRISFWVEVGDMAEGKVSWAQAQGSPDSTFLIFLKHFDVLKQTLTGIGHVYVGRNSKVGDLVSRILEMENWPALTQLLLYEVTFGNSV